MASNLEIVAFTLRVALLATLAIAPIALGLALAARRFPATLRTAVDSVFSIPLVLPPTAIGLILLDLLSRRGPLRALDLDVLFTPRAAILASAVMAFPLMHRSYRAAIESVDFRYYSVARTLGASRVRAFLTIVLPLARGGLLAGTLLAFCRALGEFGATILIAGNIPGRTQTLSLAIYERVQAGREEEATPLVITSIIIALVAIAGSELATRRREPDTP